MENENVFNELINMEDIIYFYHATNKSGYDFINDGLFMIDKDIYKTMIEMPDEFKTNPLEYSVREYGAKGTYRDKNKMNIIILGIHKEDINNFVLKSNYVPDNWTHDEEPNYYIPNDYVAGFIDCNNEEFVLNEEFSYNYSLGF